MQRTLLATISLTSLTNLHAIVWNIGADMAANELITSTETQNPNATVPQWRYGYRNAFASSAFAPFTVAQHVNNDSSITGLDGFVRPNSPNNIPSVLVNTTSSPIPYANTAIAPSEILMHPTLFTNTGTYAVVRWTAPATGTFTIDTTFRDLNNQTFGGSDGVDVGLVYNGTSINSGLIANGGSPYGVSSFNLSMVLGDTLDFVVGPGALALSNATQLA